MMSFSTKGSAKSPEVEKVAEATKIAQELAPDFLGSISNNSAVLADSTAISANS
jgi:phosphotransacetylase